MPLIKESVGDIFSAPPGSVLVHACNCQGFWGAGVALQFKRRFPKAYMIYKAHCNVVRIIDERRIPKKFPTVREKWDFMANLKASKTHEAHHNTYSSLNTDSRGDSGTSITQTSAYNVPTSQSTSTISQPLKRERRLDWNDFYKNGPPKEIIVIDDDTTLPAQEEKTTTSKHPRSTANFSGNTYQESLLGTVLLIPPQDEDGNHYWIACLFTSIGYGHGRSSEDVILTSTQKAMSKLKDVLDSMSQGRQRGAKTNVWAVRLNSGKFGIEWEKTKNVLEGCGVRLKVVRPAEKESGENPPVTRLVLRPPIKQAEPIETLKRKRSPEDDANRKRTKE